MITTVHTLTSRAPDGLTEYRGRIRVLDNGRYLYTVTSSVRRITRADAFHDAHQLADDLLRDNGITSTTPAPRGQKGRA